MARLIEIKSNNKQSQSVYVPTSVPYDPGELRFVPQGTLNMRKNIKCIASELGKWQRMDGVKFHFLFGKAWNTNTVYYFRNR